jgi:hypothetical protein
MTAQQEPEYRITESELKEYARLKAHENSADFAPLSKVRELSEKYESEIRSRGPVKQTGEDTVTMSRYISKMLTKKTTLASKGDIADKKVIYELDGILSDMPTDDEI